MAFKEWTIEKSSRGNSLAVDEISVMCKAAANGKTSSYTITLNQELSRIAYNEGKDMLAISQDDITREIALIIRTGDGIPLRLNGVSNGGKGNLVVSNKSLVSRLVKELNLTQIRSVLKISANKSKRDDVMFFLIMNPNEK